MKLDAFSYGGGWQSTACLVLASQGRLECNTFLMANTGEDSERAATLDYLRKIAIPFAERHGIAIHVLDRVKRDGTVETLRGRLMAEGSRSLPIPVRMSNTGAPGTRSCTRDFKIQVVGKWLKTNGYSATNPATIGVGLSWDEIERLENRRSEDYERVVYPLIDWRITRAECAAIIAAAGLPVPPKSACSFCPMHTVGAWATMRRDEPVEFRQAVELEATLNERRSMLGKDPVYLHRRLRPLDDAVGEGDQLSILDADDDEACDGGWCRT